MGEGVEDDRDLDLSQAAGELGVHYQTAYRWVREGTLKAVKVGKTYRVTREDLDRFSRRRAAGRSPRPIQVRDWDQQVDRFFGALRDGDERTARDTVDRLVTGGLSPLELCDELFAPALRRIGEGWTAGTTTIAEEHRASAMCERLLARLPARRTRHRGAAVVGTPEGERHGLPALMAAVALRWDGWRVHHLATDLPAGELARFLAQEAPDVVVLSATMPRPEATGAARRAAEAAGVPVLVGRGGQPLHELVESARVFSSF